MARAMKDSGIEWIGQIPQNWHTSKLKYLGKYINGYAFKPEDWESEGIPIIRIQDLTGSTDRPNFFSGEIDEKYMVENGDILVSWAATLDAFIWNKGKGWLNQHIFKAIPNEDKIDYSYFFWMIKESMKNMNNDNKHGIFMQHVTLDVFNNFSIPMPPIPEQRRIAAFLERKCAEIDSVINDTQRTIEEYKALKQSVITEAVTKGVRGKRTMKDSGIKWLPHIPCDWDEKRGKVLFMETNERSTTGEEELLTVSHITGVTPRSMKNVNMFMSESLVDYKICRIGDIAANTMWMWQGAIGVSRYHGVISPSYNTYRQTSYVYNNDYLEFLLRIPALVTTYTAYSTGITASRLRLYPDQFFQIHFPIPPLDEQKEIVEYLRKKVIEMDNLIQAKQQLLAELEIYKKSLIYEYVTGKKEVPACQ